ncbi:MAG: inositol monophosphatase [Haloarculaceae archaeon]
MTDAHHRAAIAERAARAGGIVARESFRGSLAIETKANKNDVVTAVDRDAQRQVLSTIREEFAGDPFVCEEDVVPPTPDGEDEAVLIDSVPESGPAWIVDPIDGTANYVRGNRTWATSVAAVDDGEAVAAATHLPSLGDTYAVGPDGGTRNGDELAVSDRTDPETFAVVPVGWWDMDERGEFVRLFEALVERFGDARRIGSFQTTLAMVADGSLDATVATMSASAWDTVAGVALIRAAGGTVTDIHGDPWHHDSEGLVASNGHAHEVAVEAGQAALEE